MAEVVFYLLFNWFFAVVLCFFMRCLTGSCVDEMFVYNFAALKAYINWRFGGKQLLCCRRSNNTFTTH